MAYNRSITAVLITFGLLSICAGIRLIEGGSVQAGMRQVVELLTRGKSAGRCTLSITSE